MKHGRNCEVYMYPVKKTVFSGGSLASINVFMEMIDKLGEINIIHKEETFNRSRIILKLFVNKQLKLLFYVISVLFGTKITVHRMNLYV